MQSEELAKAVMEEYKELLEPYLSRYKVELLYIPGWVDMANTIEAKNLPEFLAYAAENAGAALVMAKYHKQSGIVTLRMLTILDERFWWLAWEGEFEYTPREG